MMRKNLPFLLVLIMAFGLFGCQPKQAKETKVYVASINDMHANIDNMPFLATVVDSLRTLYPDMLLFSAGDNRSGNPINDRTPQPATPMVELMNAIGFNLSCFGNHEWDSGLDALREVIIMSEFPYVCANVTFDDTVGIQHNPYVIFERNGLKIGVIGGIQLGKNGLPDFHPNKAAGSHFRPFEEVLPEYLYLRDECNALFLLTHYGFEDDVELANKFPQVDAIFGGHTHTLVDSTRIFNGVMVTQALNKVKYLTFSTFTFDNTGKMIDKKSEVIPIAKVKTRMPEIQDMVDRYNNNEVFAQVVGYNDVLIDDCWECLGSLMADADREATGADMAFQNYGGVRFGTLEVRPITLKDVFSLDPFDNELVLINMTGQEIVDFLAVSLFTDHGPNYCSGCKYSFKLDDEGNMKDCKVVLANGKPMDLKKTYKVVMNSYMAAVFKFEHNDPGTTAFQTSNEALIDYLAKHPHINFSKALRVTER